MRAEHVLWNIDGIKGCKEVHLFEDHLELLWQADKVYVWMDADRAGQEAVERLIHQLGKRIRIVTLNCGQKDLNS